MSLLAELLSKKKKSDPSDPKGIPPTLLRAHETGEVTKRSGKRLVIFSLIGATAIAAGFILPQYMKEIVTLISPPGIAPPPRMAEKSPLPPRETVAKIDEPADAPKKRESEEVKNSGTDSPATEPEKRPAAASSGNKSRHQHRGKRLATAKPADRGEEEYAARLDRIMGSRVAEQKKKRAPEPSVPDPDMKGGLLYAASSSEKSGDWQGAVSSYLAILESDPGNYRVMSNSAAAYNRIGMYADAENMARKAIAIKNDYVPALVNAAIACSSQGKNSEALALFRAATVADPGNRSLAINLGIMQERAGNIDDALATYRRAALFGDIQAIFYMGRLLEQKGRKRDAMNAYRQILAQKDIKPAFRREVNARLTGLEE